MDCALLDDLHSEEGHRRQAEDSRITHPSFCFPLPTEEGRMKARLPVVSRLSVGLNGGPQIPNHTAKVSVSDCARGCACARACIWSNSLVPTLSLGFYLPGELTSTSRTLTLFCNSEQDKLPTSLPDSIVLCIIKSPLCPQWREPPVFSSCARPFG